jgi:hypothetical protein
MAIARRVAKAIPATARVVRMATGRRAAKGIPVTARVVRMAIDLPAAMVAQGTGHRVRSDHLPARALSSVRLVTATTPNKAILR